MIISKETRKIECVGFKDTYTSSCSYSGSWFVNIARVYFNTLILLFVNKSKRGYFIFKRKNNFTLIKFHQTNSGKLKLKTKLQDLIKFSHG